MMRRRLLAWVLILSGVVEGLAFGAVVMPRAWMEEAHRRLGLGEMPPGPLVDFLARQVSFVYGLHGVALCFLASDVRRYRPLVLLTGWGYLISGPVLFLIDRTSGMPLFWAVGDATACMVLGAVVLGLAWGDT